MHNVIKIAVLTLLLPVTASAITCTTGDVDCNIKQLQLQAIKNSGVKPTEIVQAPTTQALSNDKKNVDTQAAESKPFKIPLPSFSRPPITTDIQTSTTSTSAPTSESINASTQDNENQESDSTPKTQPQQSSPQPTGILYR